ncbi:MAG: DUF2255 family protein [Microbacteriaceae bacterium]|nr:DUF2255 family protein [Microbacteriaceae bacterium]
MNEVQELIAGAETPEVATVKKDGRAGFVPFWVVQAGDSLYARSHFGADGRWYQQATRHAATRLRIGDQVVNVAVEPVGSAERAAIDAAYRAKYDRGENARHVPAMLTDEVVATTVRLTPQEPVTI